MKVLDKLCQNGLIWQVGRTVKFSQEDLRGVDIFIYLKGGKEISLQVQSSFSEKAKRYYEGKGIRYLGGAFTKNKEEVEKEILEILNIH